MTFTRSQNANVPGKALKMSDIKDIQSILQITSKGKV